MEEQKDPKEGFSFMQETIKDDRGRRSLPKIIFIIAVLGVVFGITASATFVVVKPWLESMLTEEELVSIPQDQVESVEITQDVVNEVKEEVMDEILQELEGSDSTELAITDYEKIYEELYAVAQEAAKSIVTVQVEYSPEEEAELALSILEGEETTSSKSVTGVIVASTSTEVLVLAPSYVLEDSEKIKVKLCDGIEVQAIVKAEEFILGYVILSINKIDTVNCDIEVAVLGNSFVVQQGEMTIAIGNQFNYEDGLGYGVISSTKNELNLIDGSYSLISTDIPVGVDGTGVLLNTSGEVIGLINTLLTDETAVDALSISQLKPILEALSNGEEIPYVGIKMVDITAEIAEQQIMPLGLYVQSIELDSPAMEAGMKNGDIITSVNGVEVSDTSDYQNELLKMKQGDIMSICVQRKGVEEYVEIDIQVVVGSQS